MSTRVLKIVNALVWGGSVLVVLGIVLSYAQFAPYFQTLMYTPRIPRAPIITVVVPRDAAEPALMPFEGQKAPGVLEVAAAPPATPTLLPSPTPSHTVNLSSTLALPTPTVEPGAQPERVRIPAIELDAPVVPIGAEPVEVNGATHQIWAVPDWRAAGWHETSARVGIPGNTVLNGHNTSKGEVFRDLYKLEAGAEVLVEGDDGNTYAYEVAEKYILPEVGQPMEVRLQNAQYIQPTADERLTMVTCHPYGSLANRLLIIAYPVTNVDTAPLQGQGE
jgi:sortase A